MMLLLNTNIITTRKIRVVAEGNNNISKYTTKYNEFVKTSKYQNLNEKEKQNYDNKFNNLINTLNDKNKQLINQKSNLEKSINEIESILTKEGGSNVN